MARYLGFLESIENLFSKGFRNNLQPFFLLEKSDHKKPSGAHESNYNPETIWIFDKGHAAVRLHAEDRREQSERENNNGKDGKGFYDVVQLIVHERLVGVVENLNHIFLILKYFPNPLGPFNKLDIMLLDKLFRD